MKTNSKTARLNYILSNRRKIFKTFPHFLIQPNENIHTIFI